MRLAKLIFRDSYRWRPISGISVNANRPMHLSNAKDWSRPQKLVLINAPGSALDTPRIIEERATGSRPCAWHCFRGEILAQLNWHDRLLAAQSRPLARFASLRIYMYPRNSLLLSEPEALRKSCPHNEIRLSLLLLRT